MERTCPCGAILSRFNKGDLCAACARRDAGERLPVIDPPEPEPHVEAPLARPPLARKRPTTGDALRCSSCWRGRHTRRPYGFATCSCRDASCACGVVDA